MQGTLHSVQAQAAAKEHDTAIFVALELSKASWLIAINAPGSDKVSRYVVGPADTPALMVILTRVKAQVERWCGATARIIAIHEAGLDGFWLHRWLEAHRIESHVVDPASIAVDRRSRRVKTVSCTRFFWTPICPTGGRCGEVQHEQDQAK